MKISVLGHDVGALQIIEEIHRSAEHQLSACWLEGPLADEVSRRAIPVRRESSAENAMLANDVDVVLIALDDTEEILRLCRAAVQADRHVMLTIPAEASTAFSFELHLIHDESARCIIPLSGRLRLRQGEHSESSDSSSLLQLQMNFVNVPGEPSALRRFQIDALDCPGTFGLRYTQMTAIEAIGPDGRPLSRLLTLGASQASEQHLPPATINFRMAGNPGSSGPSVQLPSENRDVSTTGTAVADKSSPTLGANPAGTLSSTGTLTLIMSDGRQEIWRIDPAAPILPEILRLTGDRGACDRWLDDFSATMELQDAVDKSLRRRRTVDVYFDSGSERGVFKSQMAAMGCGVLMWMIFGMIAFLLLARLTTLSREMLLVARALWIAPLAIFLVAQLLLPVTRSRGGNRPPSAD
ncbi:MAG: hypothetical protein ACK526_18360 [Planctomyces sp.]